jgi:hypothetical protein
MITMVGVPAAVLSLVPLGSVAGAGLVAAYLLLAFVGYGWALLARSVVVPLGGLGVAALLLAPAVRAAMPELVRYLPHDAALSLAGRPAGPAALTVEGGLLVLSCWAAASVGAAGLVLTGGRVRRRTFAAFAVLLAAAVAGVVVRYPVAAAAACPGCYGLRPAGENVYVDGSATPGQRRRLVDMLGSARQRVGDLPGEPRSDPRVLICLSAGCYDRIGGGGEKGQALRDRALALSPGGADVVIASHELTHAELFHRLGPRYGRVPRWFHEGLAVLVSADPRYLTARPPGDRCPVEHARALAAIRGGTASGQDFYRDSACVVDRWVAGHGGPAAVADLVRRLRAGEPFAAVVVI